jgi:hypothetical protein
MSVLEGGLIVKVGVILQVSLDEDVTLKELWICLLPFYAESSPFQFAIQKHKD